ncbi:hypothetical protein CC78DRAFT_576623 [Lojkania enalia]|uniref:Uncharacterized protein n=1 Tax=Lojkania enalia TaxID=147567 RepID=A0A9P4KH78_9PLEO|nr:hypothetical protein CC78DRAFT_576623 [Didymosphaeria enalia]
MVSPLVRMQRERSVRGTRLLECLRRLLDVLGVALRPKKTHGAAESDSGEGVVQEQFDDIFRQRFAGDTTTKQPTPLSAATASVEEERLQWLRHGFLKGQIESRGRLQDSYSADGLARAILGLIGRFSLIHNMGLVGTSATLFKPSSKWC